MYQIAVIPVCIHAGRKRYDFVCIRHFRPCIIPGIGEYGIHKLLEILRFRERVCISDAPVPAGIAGDNLIFQYRSRNIDIKVGSSGITVGKNSRKALILLRLRKIDFARFLWVDMEPLADVVCQPCSRQCLKSGLAGYQSGYHIALSM